jgi:molybdopterin converting factor subunit 1
MTVTVKLFAGLREVAGTSDLAVSLPAGARVGDVRRAIVLANPALAGLLARSAVAVNHDYADDRDGIAEGDEVAIIPPVSGG